MCRTLARMYADRARNAGLAAQIRQRPILLEPELRRRGGARSISLEELLTRREIRQREALQRTEASAHVPSRAGREAPAGLAAPRRAVALGVTARIIARMWARERARLLAVARGAAPADRMLGGLLLSVYTGEIYPATWRSRASASPSRPSEEMIGPATDVSMPAGGRSFRIHRAARASVDADTRRRSPATCCRSAHDHRGRQPRPVHAGRSPRLRAGDGGPRARPAQVLLDGASALAVPRGRRAAAVSARRPAPDAPASLDHRHRRGDTVARGLGRSCDAARAPGAGARGGQAHRGAHGGRQSREGRRPRRGRVHVGPRAHHRRGGPRSRAPRPGADAAGVLAASRSERVARLLRQVRLDGAADVDHGRQHPGLHRRARFRGFARAPGASARACRLPTPTGWSRSTLRPTTAGTPTWAGSRPDATPTSCCSGTWPSRSRTW